MVHVDHEIQYIGIYFSTDWQFLRFLKEANTLHLISVHFKIVFLMLINKMLLVYIRIAS